MVRVATVTSLDRTQEREDLAILSDHVVTFMGGCDRSHAADAQSVSLGLVSVLEEDVCITTNLCVELIGHALWKLPLPTGA